MRVHMFELLDFFMSLAAQKTGDFQEVWIPVGSGAGDDGELHFKALSRLREGSAISLDTYRPVDPVKTLFYRFREQVLPSDYPRFKQLVVGVKACDLQGLSLLDKALLTGDVVDPAYLYWRTMTTIITTDCSDTTSSCHCTLVHGNPYPKSGFDINLSRLDDMYLMEIGSEKGQALVSLMKKHISVEESTVTHQETVYRNRQEMVERLHNQNKKFFRSGTYEELHIAEMERWDLESDACIGCGACTNICPSCYCLILSDESDSGDFKKVRSYDSCQLNGYARVAGGGTPRPRMSQRFRNRYLCKFSYMPDEFGALGCTGCGRCEDACPGNISFRGVLRELTDHAVKTVSRVLVESA